MTRRMGRLVFILALAAAPAAAVRAQSYGTGDQILTIGPSEFRPGDFFTAGRFTTGLDGYLYQAAVYYAPVNLPEGAVVTLMCFYGYDADPEWNISAYLQEVKLPAGGQSPGNDVVAAVGTNFDIGYGTVCTPPLSYVVHSSDALGEHLARQIQVQFPVDGLGLGGVRITWHREVSPLPATSSFDDVPLGSAFSQFVEALKASGITAGCQADPPLYCPDRPITRAEMAVYLSLALGLHWVE